MAPRALLIGLGDLGYRIAQGLASAAGLDELVLAGGGKGRGPALAGKLDCCYQTRVRYAPLDGTDGRAVEALLRRERPDLVVQCASLVNPWEILAAPEPRVARIRDAGVGIQLPAWLPITIAVMRAVRALDLAVPVANLPWPDGTHPVLARLGLVPTIGLGNPGMILLRVRAALRHEAAAEGRPAAPLPLVRILGDASTLWHSLAATPPADGEDGCRVYLGEDGRRADYLAYRCHPWPLCFELNELTAASALPVLRALLPGAAPLRFTCPGIDGHPGGYPVRIAEGRVDYDLPPGVTLEDAIAFNTRHAREEGIERVEDDGTVIYTERARAVLADIDPALAAPLHPDAAAARFGRLMAALGLS